MNEKSEEYLFHGGGDSKYYRKKNINTKISGRKDEIHTSDTHFLFPKSDPQFSLHMLLLLTSCTNMSVSFHSWLSSRPTPKTQSTLMPIGRGSPSMSVAECIRFGAKPKSLTTPEGLSAAQKDCFKNMKKKQNRMGHGLGLNEYGTTGEVI